MQRATARIPARLGGRRTFVQMPVQAPRCSPHPNTILLPTITPAKTTSSLRIRLIGSGIPGGNETCELIAGVAPCSLTKFAIRAGGASRSSDQMPKPPCVMRPRGSTADRRQSGRSRCLQANDRFPKLTRERFFAKHGISVDTYSAVTWHYHCASSP
jgi:hypothetical protein